MRRVQKQPQNRFHPSQTHFDDEQHSQPHSDDDRFHHSQPHSPMGLISIFNLCGMRRLQKQLQNRFHRSQPHFDRFHHSQPHFDDEQHSQPHSDDEQRRKIQADEQHSQPHSDDELRQEIQVDEQQYEIQVDHSQPHSDDEQRQEIQVDEQQHEIQVDQEEEADPAHLLDMLRTRLLGFKPKKKGQISKDVWWKKLLNRDKSKPWLSINNAKELKDKGIRFKGWKKVNNITIINFNKHCCMPTLWLSPIVLRSTTMPLLLNLMAYELCPDFKENCEITSHLSLLDSLIDNGEDVKELRDANVLHHELGSDEAVAKLFNKINGILVPNLVIDSKVKAGIHTYCNSCKSHFSGLRASVVDKLTHTFFRSPWTFLVFLSALAGLIMTGMQTYYSYRENKLRR
ncbi:hypothetical protein SLA2020_201950 [Shorea laevis]